MDLKTRALRPVPAVPRSFALVGATAIMLVAGCAQQPTVAPPRPAASVRPPDWFHQQLAAARVAKRAHQPKADTAGAQQAYDDVMRAACTRAALMGPDKYPVRCDAVLHQPLDHSPTDPCEGNDDLAGQTAACSD